MALAPNPLSDPALGRLDVAVDSLQQCVEATLELLEGALLAQEQQQQQRRQRPQDGEAIAGVKRAGTSDFVSREAIASGGTRLQVWVEASGGRVRRET